MSSRVCGRMSVRNAPHDGHRVEFDRFPRAVVQPTEADGGVERKDGAAVIWDSSPWRDHLTTEVHALRRRAKSKRTTEKRSLLIERTVFFAAYTMRRLDDANKLSSSWRGTAVKCSQYPALGERPNQINWHHLEKFYNISKPITSTIGARHFCDLVIHSYIFVECVQEDRKIEGFFITSDKKVTHALWLFSVNAIAELMERTAGDDPSTVIMDRNDRTGDLEAWAGNGEPPSEWNSRLAKGSRRPRLPEC